MKTIRILSALLVLSCFLHAQNAEAQIKSKQNLPFEYITVKNLNTGLVQTFENVEKVSFTQKNQGLEPSFSLETQIYPNPALDVVNVRLFNPSEEQVSINVYTVTGQLLAGTARVLPQGAHSAVLTGLPAGIAIVRVANGNQVTSSKVLVNVDNQLNPLIAFLEGSGVEHFKIHKESAVEYDEGDRFMVIATQNGQTMSVSFTPQYDASLELDFVVCIDANGNQYPTVQIGSQLWMAENLISTSFSNGDNLLKIDDDQIWKNLKSPAFSVYDNEEDKSNHFGLLYNGFSALDERNICPNGWRVPSDDDWTVLEKFITEHQYSATAGNILIADKEWEKQGFDVFGFGAVPAGLRYAHNGKFGHAGVHGRWWTATKTESGKIWNRYINTDKDYLGRGEYDSKYGYSIRCIKD